MVDRYPDQKNVIVLKEMIIFITPKQNNIEMILRNKWKIKLVGVRSSDGFESITKFNFDYFPDDYYVPCIFCELQPDGYSLPAKLPVPASPARPGIRKRKMEIPASTPPAKTKSSSETKPAVKTLAAQESNLYTSPQNHHQNHHQETQKKRSSVIKFGKKSSSTSSQESSSKSSQYANKHKTLLSLLNKEPSPKITDKKKDNPSVLPSTIYTSPQESEYLHFKKRALLSTTLASSVPDLPPLLRINSDQDHERNSVSSGTGSSYSLTNEEDIFIPLIKIEDE